MRIIKINIEDEGDHQPKIGITDTYMTELARTANMVILLAPNALTLRMSDGMVIRAN